MKGWTKPTNIIALMGLIISIPSAINSCQSVGLSPTKNINENQNINNINININGNRSQNPNLNY